VVLGTRLGWGWTPREGGRKDRDEENKQRRDGREEGIMNQQEREVGEKQERSAKPRKSVSR